MSRRNRRSRRMLKKTIYSYILAFLLMLALMGIAILSLGKYSMFSERAVQYTCSRVEYADGVRKEIRSEAQYMGIPYGIDKKCLKGVFSNKQIESDMSAVFSAQVEGKEYIVDGSNISKKITENVEAKYGELDDKEKESLQNYISDVVKLYQKKMVIPGSNYIVKGVNIMSKLALVGIPVCILIAVLCIFFLISTRKYTYHGLRYIAYGTLGAGITLTTVFSAFISNGAIYKFNISDVYMRKFFTFFIGHHLLVQVFAGIGMIIAGCVVIYLVMRQKNRIEY